MSLTPSGHWRLGFALSLSTALLWGVLPLALKQLLVEMDALTITWFRFLAALVVLWFWLRYQKALPDWKKLQGRCLLWMGIAVLGLVGNYVCYLTSLNHISPAGAQALIQLAPMMFLLASVYFFREHFGPWQWAGFTILVIGLLLFFNQRWHALATQQEFAIGLWWMIAASITWAAYAIAQKVLLKFFSSPQILLVIYLIASIILLPFAHVEQRDTLTDLGVGLLLFACANTLLAYGAFAEALVHWEGSRVSATLAITPLITLFASLVVAHFLPEYVQLEPLNQWSYLGAVFVVGGSMLSALKRQ